MAARAPSLGRLALAWWLATAICVADPLHSAESKISRIMDNRAPRGSVVLFSATELAAFGADEAESIAPGAVHNLRVLLTPGHAEVTASMNFLKIRQAQGETDTWLMRQLLDGERPVRVRVAIQSAEGRARVDVELVEVSGVPMEGKTLDFLVRRFVIPNFPEARVSEWFPLEHNVERLNTRTGAVAVTMRR